MRKRKGIPFRVCGIFDTETTNIKIGSEWHAFPVCYQVNDVREVDISRYVARETDDIRIYRDVSDMLAYVEDLVQWGHVNGCVPIIAGYNLLFDLQTILYELSKRYAMEVSAQSSTNVYTLDLMADGKRVLRWWDTFHLEMRGLAAMGEIAGLYKLKGDWDYSSIRTPETPLTDLEIGYASRDVQVIPAYLRYLVEVNDWLRPDMLGVKVLTKTSLVRRMAEHEIGTLAYTTRKGGRRNLMQLFIKACRDELPGCYYDYALRKACFRGGFTFTAARFASVTVRNVASADVTSMHHTFINGRYIPEHFAPCDVPTLRAMRDSVLSVTRDQALDTYWKPFRCAFHARFEIRGIRLRRGSAFERWGIACIPRGKFGKRIEGDAADFSRSEAAQEAEEGAKLAGWRDSACNAVFAFGKLYSADSCILHLSEIELWTIAQVYEWDSCEPILGEGTLKWSLPPDYVTLQSNVLFRRKQDMKRICKAYRDHTPYTDEIPSSIPSGMADGLRHGSLSADFVSSYYSSTVKGMFNAIYGTQAQDVFKPDYEIEDAIIEVDRDTTLTPENFETRQPKVPKVMYCYGMRIVGGSRMHLAIAISCLYDALGDRVRVTGGDTDSLKISCDPDVSDEDLRRALAPLAAASKAAIDKVQTRVRERYPHLASTLDGIGSFDIEECGDAGTRWAHHMEAWNKARVSCDSHGRSHITCAGLSRPDGEFTIEDFIDERLSDAPPDEVFPQVLGYNVFIRHDVGHGLQRTNPLPMERFDRDITDYLGHVAHVSCYEAVALYPCGRWLGETDMPANAENVRYLHDVYGRDVETCERTCYLDGGDARIFWEE